MGEPHFVPLPDYWTGLGRLVEVLLRCADTKPGIKIDLYSVHRVFDSPDGGL